MRVAIAPLLVICAAAPALAEPAPVQVDRAFLRNGFITVLVSAANPDGGTVASERVECGAFDAGRRALGTGVQYVTAIPPRTTVAAQVLIPAPPGVIDAAVTAECRVTDRK